MDVQLNSVSFFLLEKRIYLSSNYFFPPSFWQFMDSVAEETFGGASSIRRMSQNLPSTILQIVFNRNSNMRSSICMMKNYGTFGLTRF